MNLKFLNLVENHFPFSASYFFSLADQRGIYTGNSFGIEIKEMAAFKIENFFQLDTNSSLKKRKQSSDIIIWLEKLD